MEDLQVRIAKNLGVIDKASPHGLPPLMSAYLGQIWSDKKAEKDPLHTRFIKQKNQPPHHQ
jgi:hypothetical protein